MSDKRISILDYIYRAAQYKWKILVNFFIVCALAVGISLIVPKTYLASATVLPASDEIQNMGISALLSDIPAMGGLGGLMAGLGSEGTTLVAILNSRSLKDSLIQKFDLMKLYKTKTMVETRKALEQYIGFELTEEGTIKVFAKAKTKYFSFGDQDDEAKNRCYAMAVYMLERLDRMNQELRTESAKNQRVFIEKRYMQNKNDLNDIENEFSRFQKRTGVIALEEQTKATIEVIAQVKALVVAKEVELAQYRQIMSPEHNTIITAQKELAGLEEKYDELLSRPSSGETPDVFLSMSSVPQVGVEYLRLYRDLLTQEKIQEFLVPMYEQAKIQEAKDTPSLQVLDSVIVPDKKFKPKRAFIVLFAGFASLVLSLIYIYLKVNLEDLREHDDTTYRKLQRVAKEFSLKK
ncbi:hypothetical protein JXA02_00595 [candidate division KSB1 bacterium]|nr:hypothetical protein [candidate division KSB1 bacterium]RQW11412.1 MAG: hypothetical protein EH222_00630 [candidate division KSB1 bacterium]